MQLDNLQGSTSSTSASALRMMVNQYEVRAVSPDGTEGELLAFAQQKRLAFKEQVTIYTDDSKQHPLLGFKARQRSTSAPRTTSPTRPATRSACSARTSPSRCSARPGTSSRPACRR